MITNKDINQSFKGTWYVGDRIINTNPIKDSFVRAALEDIRVKGSIKSDDINTLKLIMQESGVNITFINAISSYLQGAIIRKTGNSFFIEDPQIKAPVVEFSC